ncbi:hypothetical protein BDY19DRAFT_1008191, partial [Irpex rosettiformis]
RLLIAYPDHDAFTTFKSVDVCAVAEKLLQRTNVDQEILPSDEDDSDDSDLEMSDDNSDSSSSSDNSSTSLSSEDESDHRSRKSGKSNKKSKHSKKSSKKDKSSKSKNKPTSEKPLTTKLKGDTELDGLIEKLGKMSINDLMYIAMYFEVVQKNSLVQIVMDSLHQQRALQAQSVSMSNSSRLSALVFKPRPPARNEERHPYLDRLMCFSCRDPGHQAFECLKLAKFVNNGVIRCTTGERPQWSNGKLVRCLQGEIWIEAIKRQNIASSNFAIYEDKIYDDGNQSEYEDYADSYTVTRSDRNARTNCKEQFEGVFVPARREVEQRRSGRAMENNA